LFDNSNQATWPPSASPKPGHARGFARKTPYKPSGTARSSGQAGGRYKSRQPVRAPCVYDLYAAGPLDRSEDDARPKRPISHKIHTNSAEEPFFLDVRK
jgi:hypothetical protein